MSNADDGWKDATEFADGLRPAPQGRAHRIRKRSNHVTIVLGSKTAVENITKE